MLFDIRNEDSRMNMRRAGLEKYFLTINDDDETIIVCYCEKGSRVPEKPSIVFIHGFSSDKHAWSTIIKVNINNYYYRKINVCYGYL